MTYAAVLSGSTVQPFDYQFLYDPTVAEPKPARRASIFDLIDRLLPSAAREAEGAYEPSIHEAALRIRQVTGWSDRTMAIAFGTSHPTVKALLDGRTVKRVIGLDERIKNTLALIDRLSVAAQNVNRPVASVLERQGADGRSALDLMARGDFGLAYVVALDALRPPRQSGLMQGMWPAAVGQSSSAVTHEER